jgi:hypothetical protein
MAGATMIAAITTIAITIGATKVVSGVKKSPVPPPGSFFMCVRCAAGRAEPVE